MEHQITEENLKALKEKLHSLGFPERLDEAIDYYNQHTNFSVPYVAKFGNDTLYCDLQFEAGSDGLCHFTSYDATLREEVAIPEMNIDGINTRQLDNTLKVVDKWYDDALSNDFEKKQPEEILHINETIQTAHAQLLKLQASEGDGKETAKLLMFKYWAEVDYQKFFKDYAEIKERFEINCKVSSNEMMHSVEETYNYLKDIAAKKLMENGHVISDEVMKEIQVSIANQEYWLAYNTWSYFLEREDVFFFKTQEEAEDFALNNFSDHDSFAVIKALSIDDVLKQIPYGKVLENYLNHTTNQLLSPSNQNAFIELKQSNLSELKDELKELGFSERIIPAINFYINRSECRFQVQENERSQEEKIRYLLSYQKNPNTDTYFLKGYEATLQLHPNIPDTTINGVNTKELDARMKSIDWSIEHHAESLVYDYIKTQEGHEFLDKIHMVLKDINELYQADGLGKEAAEKLMYKHWYGEPWEPNTLSLEHLKLDYQWSKIVSINESKLQAKSETYQQLKDVALKHLEQVNKQSITNQSFVMNEQNLQYLKDNIKYLGFGEKLFPELEKNIEQGLPEFQMKISTEFHNDKIGAELHFKKSETNDMYFLNRYDATLEKSDGKKLSQPFYLNKGNGVTIKEAYNLLNGRAVNKDLTNQRGEKYNAWIQLDLSHKNEKGSYVQQPFHKNYGYDLEQSLSKFSIKELNDSHQKDTLLKSLQKGNLQSVTFELNGKEQKMLIAANPKLKTINVYDSNMKLQQHDSLKKNEGKEQLINKEETQGVEQKTKDKSEDKKQEMDQSHKKGKVVKMNSDDSLLPKKRTSQKKGLSIS